MNFYDCFMFFDEDILLDVRLNILNKTLKNLSSQSLYTPIKVKKEI